MQFSTATTLGLVLCAAVVATTMAGPSPVSKREASPVSKRDLEDITNFLNGGLNNAFQSVLNITREFLDNNQFVKDLLQKVVDVEKVKDAVNPFLGDKLGELKDACSDNCPDLVTKFFSQVPSFMVPMACSSVCEYISNFAENSADGVVDQTLSVLEN